MSQYSAFLATLAGQAHPDGGWGYVHGTTPQLEPTCLALLALSLDKTTYAAQIAGGRKLLDSCRKPDGSYRLALGRQEAVWPTAQVAFVRAVLEEKDVDLAASAAFLLHVEGRQIPKEQANTEVNEVNQQLIGWPWGEGNFSWVEPTSWSCLALRSLGQGQHVRVQNGLQVLLDRAYDDGGTNYGNKRVLGKRTDPELGPSTLFLLAVQGESHPRIDATVDFVLRHWQTNDLEYLCWTKLALDLYGQNSRVAEVLDKIDHNILAAHSDRQQSNWLRPNCVRQALTALALGVSERNFFRLPANPAAVAVPAFRENKPKASFTEKVGKWFKNLTVNAVGNIRPLPATSRVSIARAAKYDDKLADVLQAQFEKFREQVPLKDKRVVLKPNMVEFHPDKVINTDPRFVSAVIDMCKREGAKEVIVAEGPGHCRNIEHIVAACGLGAVLAKHRVPFVDINHDEPMKLPNLGRLTGLEYLYLSKTIATADVLISLPKLKTHHWAGATLSLKNLFGTLPGICYGWPKNELHWRGIDNSIVDIALTRTPEFAIVDGIVGMEGDGPLNGTAKEFGAVIMGNDLVAVDATCCRLMMLDPERVAYLNLGHGKRLGRLRAEEIEQVGEVIAALAQPFATVPHMESLCMKKSA